MAVSYSKCFPKDKTVRGSNPAGCDTFCTVQIYRGSTQPTYNRYRVFQVGWSRQSLVLTARLLVPGWEWVRNLPPTPVCAFIGT